jgi:23S rRNA (uracil1939-C5)-methyltransferase
MGEADRREVIIEIDGLAMGGDAIGRQRDPAGAESASDGRATFVPLAAPGERVRARIEREKGRVAWAELTAIERPGSDRVPPPCPLFGSCGGCQWQHVSIGAQRAAKKAIVERALGISIPPVRVVGPDFGYRDRAKLTVGKAGTSPGTTAGTLGFHARRSHDVVDLGDPPRCPLFGPELARALPALRALARGMAAGIELEAQAGAEGVHLNVVGADAVSTAHARREIDRLNEAGIVGLSLAGKPTLGRAEVDVAEPGSPPLAISAGGFAQVGRAANAALVATVMEAVGPDPGVVLEMYAGSGTFTRHLVTGIGERGRVFACDGDPAAVARGRRNVPAAAWSARPPPDSPDTVVLDPPREGADRFHLTAAIRARRRIVYVSCDPQTLGRDARHLKADGFRLVRAVALDLMPQTFHVEVVATFELGDRAGEP